MGKIKVAIYDEDKGYRERFADYLMNYKPQEIELSVYTQIEYFLNQQNVDKYHLVVLGGGYEDVLAQVKEIQIPVLVLTEYAQSYVKETVDFAKEQVVYTSKYQSMDVITRQMRLMTEAGRVRENSRLAMHEMEVVGICSPVKHEMQMFFSLLYARNVAKYGKVLYINLLELSGFSELFGETEYDFGDVILLLREERCQPERILACIYELEDISYLSPLQSLESIREITAEDIKRLLEFVAVYTDFQTVVIDLGTALAGVVEVLLECAKIYCLIKKGYYYDVQQEQFLSFLEKSVDAAFEERMIMLELPYLAKVISGRANLLEQLDWSEFGDFVRQIC